MKQFFTKQETESKSRPSGKTLSCVSCGLYKNVQSPKMKPFGNFRKGILNIGEAPGQTEDRRGRPWQGKMGQFLQQTYRKLGVGLFEDCLNVNAINCRPMGKEGSNRPPTNQEIDACRRFILKTIEEYQPKVIILLGNAAVYSLIGHRWQRNLGNITKWRGWAIPDHDFKCWVCPTFHPSFVSRAEGKEVETIWKQDLKQAIECIDKPLPRYRKPNIHIIEDLSELRNLKSKQIAFDYETTGLKPQAKGHRIVCASVAINENHCFVFMMPVRRSERQPFVDILADGSVSKMAHNMKFEETWSVVRLRQPVRGWLWDSMLAAHILDNRPGVTSLKFQAYVQFGIVDYESEVSPYLQASKEGGNEMNRVYELLKKPGGKDKLLQYCGLDSIYEYRLALKQRREMNYNSINI